MATEELKHPQSDTSFFNTSACHVYAYHTHRATECEYEIQISYAVRQAPKKTLKTCSAWGPFSPATLGKVLARGFWLYISATAQLGRWNHSLLLAAHECMWRERGWTAVGLFPGGTARLYDLLRSLVVVDGVFTDVHDDRRLSVTALV